MQMIFSLYIITSICRAITQKNFCTLFQKPNLQILQFRPKCCANHTLQLKPWNRYHARYLPALKSIIRKRSVRMSKLILFKAFCYLIPSFTLTETITNEGGQPWAPCTRSFNVICIDYHSLSVFKVRIMLRV